MMGIGIHMMKMNATGASGKGTMPSLPCCLELGPERRSRTENLDPAFSYLNRYHMPPGVATGRDLAEWLEDCFDEANEARRARGQRANRRDCDRAATFALAPDEASLALLTPEERLQVADAMVAGLSSYMGHAPDAWVVHLDEGTHPGEGLNVHVVDRMLAGPDEYALTRVVTPAWLKGMHDAVPAAIEARLPESVLAKVGGVEVHLSEEERRARGMAPRRSGRHANEYAEAQEILKAADEEALDIHLSAAGEQEAARQHADAIEEGAERERDEAALDAERASAALAAATRRREDEERKADEAEQARRAADKARAQADSDLEKAQADLATARRRARSLSAEGSGLDWNAPGDGRVDMGEAAGRYRYHEPSLGEVRRQRDEARAEAEAEEARRDAAKAEADEAAKARDAAREQATQASADAAAAAKRRDAAKHEADEAARAAADAKKAQADAEQLRDKAQRGYDEVAADVSAKQAEYRDVERQVADRRLDLEVATKRGSFKLSAVVSKVIDVCADALGAVLPDAAQWLRDRADGLRERAIDAVAPETKARALADFDGPDDDDMRDDYELGG